MMTAIAFVDLRYLNCGARSGPLLDPLPFNMTLDVREARPQIQTKLLFSTFLSYFKLQLGGPLLNDCVAFLHLNAQICRDLLEIAEYHIPNE